MPYVALEELALWDWVITTNGRVLHHLLEFDDSDEANAQWGGAGTTACGRHSNWLCIPGMFTRMGAQRCKRCSRVLGWPEGKGSPKNDNALRPLVEQQQQERNV